MKNKSPIDIILDKVKWYCTVCSKQHCKCWKKCECGWSYRNKKGFKCRNPIHKGK